MQGNLAHSTQADRRAKARLRERGFSILEMVLASAILMVGIVSVLQLVPASLQSSVGNRMDTMATAVAQRELDQMLSQPVNLTPPSFTDSDGNIISLGGVGSPGASVLMSGQSVVVDFSPSAVPPAGFSTTYKDPSDPNASSFELRWAVFPQVNNGVVVSRRIVIGCRRVQSGGNSQLLLPVTLDSSVWK